MEINRLWHICNLVSHGHDIAARIKLLYLLVHTCTCQTVTASQAITQTCHFIVVVFQISLATSTVKYHPDCDNYQRVSNVQQLVNCRHWVRPKCWNFAVKCDGSYGIVHVNSGELSKSSIPLHINCNKTSFPHWVEPDRTCTCTCTSITNIVKLIINLYTHFHKFHGP